MFGGWWLMSSVVHSQGAVLAWLPFLAGLGAAYLWGKKFEGF
jgi:hypothetical protein